MIPFRFRPFLQAGAPVREREVGAFTSPISRLGWLGRYIEPVTMVFVKQRSHHNGGKNHLVVNHNTISPGTSENGFHHGTMGAPDPNFWRLGFDWDLMGFIQMTTRGKSRLNGIDWDLMGLVWSSVHGWNLGSRTDHFIEIEQDTDGIPWDMYPIKWSEAFPTQGYLC